MFPQRSQKTVTHVYLYFPLFQGWVSNQLAFNVRRAATWPADLLQVDLLASEQAFFGREAADRERSTCLSWRVTIGISRQKWGVAWIAFGVSGFICESLTSMAECADSTPTKSIERVCVFCISIIEGANLFTLCESWRTQAAGKKTKNLFQSRVNTGKRDLQWLFFTAVFN